MVLGMVSKNSSPEVECKSEIKRGSTAGIVIVGALVILAILRVWPPVASMGHGVIVLHTGGDPRTNIAFEVEDDFNGLKLDDWAVESGSWAAARGFLAPVEPSVAGLATRVCATGNANIWVSYRFASSSQNQGAEFAFRSDPDSGQRLYVKLTSGAIELVEKCGPLKVLASANVTATPDEWYELRILADGSNVTVWRATRSGAMAKLFSCPSCTVQETSRIECATEAGSDVGFDNLRVESFNQYVQFAPIAQSSSSLPFTVEAIAAPRWDLERWIGGGVKKGERRIQIEGMTRVPGAVFKRTEVKIVLRDVEGGRFVGNTAGTYTLDAGDPFWIEVVPEPDHPFDSWDSPLDAYADREQPSTVIRLKQDTTVVPSYYSRPGVGAIDAVADMTYFLTVIDQSKALHAESAVDTFDFNNIRYDANGKNIYCGNGMPDVVELYLIQRIVKIGRTGLTDQSGVGSNSTWDAWSKNFAQAQRDLPGQDIRVQRVVASYMTVGNYETIRLVEHLVRTTFGVELTEEEYDRKQQRFLKPDEDADNDGFVNQGEWELASPDGSLSNLKAYGTAALDGQRPVPAGK